jgi:hypothetical protein
MDELGQAGGGASERVCLVGMKTPEEIVTFQRSSSIIRLPDGSQVCRQEFFCLTEETSLKRDMCMHAA